VTRAVLALGSNLGDRLATLQVAVQSLARHPDVGIVAVSCLYETDPIGGPDQEPFFNAVVAVDTPLSPHELLDVAHDIEDAAHRVRDVRWGPRTLDIDLVAMDDMTLSDADLTLPHPLAHERAFVLVPWIDVEPDAQIAGRPVSGWLSEVGHSGVRRYAREWVDVGVEP
jgi:2-amino-4-hydroxy-6-hydroxymethyldihydropteridine diphosphokinase